MLKSKVKEESGVRALGIRFFFREENLCSFKAFCMSWTKSLWIIKKFRKSLELIRKGLTLHADYYLQGLKSLIVRALMTPPLA